jgi:hypothetical protein
VGSRQRLPVLEYLVDIGQDLSSSSYAAVHRVTFHSNARVPRCCHVINNEALYGKGEHFIDTTILQINRRAQINLRAKGPGFLYFHCDYG